MNAPIRPRMPNLDRTAVIGIGIVLLLHGLALGLILTHAPARQAVLKLVPTMVRLINEEPAPAPKADLESDIAPKPLPVKRPQQPQPAAPSTVLTVQAPVAATDVSVSPEPKPAIPLEARPPLAPSPTTLAANVMNAAVTVAPAPLIPPAFNADYLDNPAPAYPALSRRTGEEGRVLLRVFVEANGLPSKVEIRSSSGSERLDQAALEAVRRWKFVPARQGDRAVPASVVVPIAFNLKG